MKNSTIQDKTMKMKNSETDKLAHLANIIEETLDSFGIRARVVEIYDEEVSIVFNLEVIMGTPIEDVEKRSRDLALALAAPDGKIEIIAPVPGKSFISIVLKKPKKGENKKGEQYKILRVKEKEYVTFDYVQSLKQKCAIVLYLIAYAFQKAGDFVNTKYDIEEYSDDMPKKDDEKGAEKKKVKDKEENKPVRYWLLLIAAFVLGMFAITFFYMSL